MKFGRGARPSTLASRWSCPSAGEDVTLVPRGGSGIPARVLERGADTLLVAIMVPIEPLSAERAGGLVLEFVGRPRAGAPAAATRRWRTRPSPTSCGSRSRVRSRCSRNASTCASGPRAPCSSTSAKDMRGRELHRGSQRRRLPAGRARHAEDRRATSSSGSRSAPGELAVSGTGKVVRVDSRGRRAVAFEEISEPDRRRLIRFIFDCQRDRTPARPGERWLRAGRRAAARSSSPPRRGRDGQAAPPAKRPAAPKAERARRAEEGQGGQEGQEREGRRAARRRGDGPSIAAHPRAAARRRRGPRAGRGWPASCSAATCRCPPTRSPRPGCAR